MLKKKIQSEVAISTSQLSSDAPSETAQQPTDNISVKILCLRVPDEEPKPFTIRVVYFDQLLLKGIVKSIGARDPEEDKLWAQGDMNYDPSDYEKMCQFADYPLVVNIQSLTSVDKSHSSHSLLSKSESGTKSNSIQQDAVDIYCCNIDILPIFQGDEGEKTFIVRKRMEPMIQPTALMCKSWDCLPLLKIEVTVTRHCDNTAHHKVLKEANWMKLTLVASYNMPIAFQTEYMYTAASKVPLHSEYNTVPATYNQGTSLPLRFNIKNFYPKWESLRIGDDLFTKGDLKFTCNLDDIKNEDGIDLNKYLTKKFQPNTVVWGSFHRSMLLKKSSEQWLSNDIRINKWPFELHIYAEDGGYSFMAFINLFQFLYPGVKKTCFAVPLYWYDSSSFMEQCGCQCSLTPNDKLPSLDPNRTVNQQESRILSESYGSNDAVISPHNTGADENNAFVIIEVELARPLKRITIQRPIPDKEIMNMLRDIETSDPSKRHCTGRGQLDRDWQSTVWKAAAALRTVPYYGITDFCAFNRQLSETRTRIELTTSFWQEAAVYVNNNFVVQPYLDSEEIFQELRTMAHVCLVKLARLTLLEDDQEQKARDPLLRAARQARQMQDHHHAMELYLQLTVQKPRDANIWRELSTCLKDIDKDWADVCLNESVVLNPRHPLTLVAKGGAIYEVNRSAAEQFMTALLAYYPFWTTAWIIASAYYYSIEYFVMADKILDIVRQNRREGIMEEVGYARAWERELGDWWDFTPLLPGMSPFYDAADLLLRLRCVALAEVCIARALIYGGETSAYYHMVALCCRLRGDYKEAVCHIGIGLQKFGEISHLKTLKGECLHKLDDIEGALASFESTSGYGPFTTLMSLPTCKDPQRRRAVLVDLIRRMPSSYAWIGLAHDWLKKANTMKEKSICDSRNEEEQTAAVSCAVACAIEALKWDRSAGSAWALLANNVKPSARRYYCAKMANLCCYKFDTECDGTDADSQQSLCYRLGTPVTMCRCVMCKHLLM